MLGRRRRIAFSANVAVRATDGKSELREAVGSLALAAAGRKAEWDRWDPSSSHDCRRPTADCRRYPRPTASVPYFAALRPTEGRHREASR